MSKYKKLEINNIYNMDCLKGLKLLVDKTIDLVVTSPPYDNLREYNGYIFNENYFKDVIKELYRVLKEDGVIVWIVNDETKKHSESGTSFKQALTFKDAGFCLYDTMIFAKNNPVPKNHKRYEQAFEYMFIFSKGNIKTFNPITIPCKCAGKINSGTLIKKPDGIRRAKSSNAKVKDTKIKGNIWYYTVSSKDKKHPAVFPPQLAIDHIKSWSNKGDLVLDIFMGSGTTAIAAIEEERNYLGFEISKEYCEEADLLINEAKNKHKNLSINKVTNQHKDLPEQIAFKSILDETKSSHV